ncbi:MAG TPA: Ig-like domain-containing protein [Anaerolineaceae bacterium]|nr:Ig-like domain-containing protein [Anaerolineaceae bacterium]
MKRHHSLRWISSVVLFLSILSTACGQATPSPTPQPQPTAKPTSRLLGEALAQQNQDLPPKVTGRSPAEGEEAGPQDSLSISFDQSMDPEATADALQVLDADQQPVEGKVSWNGPRTVVFKPASALSPGQTYQAKIGTGAKSAQGKALAEAVSLKFQAAGELKVSQVFPADGTTEVDSKAAITVMFNRPVVPLVIAEDQSKLPNPLQIDPEVQGHGEWINTALFVFRPEGFLKGGTSYTVTVPAGLNDADGGALAQAYSWSFTTHPPQVGEIDLGDQINPAMDQPNVRLDPTVSIRFLQPMDPASVEAALSLKPDSGSTAQLSTQWKDENTWLTVKPARLLALDTRYTLKIEDSAKAADGGALQNGLTWTFTTVLPPGASVIPPSNTGPAGIFGFVLKFASPMDFKSLADKVEITPALDEVNNHWYNEYDWSLTYFGLKPSTTYTVKILPGMKDTYGNELPPQAPVSFTTQAAPPSAMLYMPGLPVYRWGGPQDFYLRYTNVNTISAQLFSLSKDEFMNMMRDYTNQISYAGQASSQVWSFAENSTGKLNEKVIKDLTFQDKAGNPLAPGFYFLGMNASPLAHTNGPFVENRILLVATDNITLKNSPGNVLAWATDLTTGKPTPNLALRVYDGNFAEIAAGKTDANGLFQADVPLPGENMDPNARYVLTDDPQRLGFTYTYWGSGVSPYDFGISEQYYQAPQNLVAYVYTDRPLYRPGQPVYFKGILRKDDDLSYKLPDANSVHVTIADYEKTVYDEVLPLNEMGSFSGQFDLGEDTTLGFYNIQASVEGQQAPAGAVGFNVAEYRRPEFQVQTSAEPKNVLPGDAYTVSLDASYYSGGGLANADVNWTLNSDPFTFTPPDDLSQFSFSDAEQDNWTLFNEGNLPSNGKQLGQGKGQTDENGKFSLKQTADAGKDGGSQRITFEASVTDFALTTVTGRSEVILHQSQVYPGIRSTSYVGATGQEQSFELVAVDWDGKLQPGMKVDVEIVERQWLSVQEEDSNGVLRWKNTVKENPVTSFKDVTLDGQGRGKVAFTPAKGGIYRARITARDAKGNEGAASAFIWVAGDDYIPWMQSNSRGFQLVADKATYQPGETAELLIASPFQGEATTLVTVERGRVRASEVVQLKGNSTIYKLPLRADMAPNVYVSVVVVKGVDADNPRPNFKVGMIRLKVMTSAQALNVTVKPDKATAGPGERVTYAVHTSDGDGKPVKAEVSLALSDLATLSLSDPNSAPILDFFYSPRSLSVSTALGITQSSEEYNAMITDHLKAEGAGMGAGGGKGSGVNGVIEVRQNFPDTAFWKADLVTGDDGNATAAVTLPDNLTTWRMDARAVTGDTRVGQTTVDLVSTRPLLVRPQTPRFFVAGDHARLGAAVHNNTDQDLQALVTLEASGITLDGEAAQTVQIAAHRQALVTWEGNVPLDSTRVDLTFRAAGGDYQDASRPTIGTLDNNGLPVYRYEAPETVGTAGQLSENGTRVEAISLPDGMKVTQGKLEVELAPSLAAGMLDGLSFLEHYPYECTEQTVSRFLPNVLTTAALKGAGLSNPDLEANLKNQVAIALQKLYSHQHPDGGWGWWDEQQSDPLTSAYVVLGLVEAKNAGYDVNGDVVSRGVRYLLARLITYEKLNPPEKVNRQAFLLYVLARSGSPAVSSTVQLYNLRTQLDLYARAFLMQTLYIIDPQDGRLKTLISDLASAAILSASGTHWEEKTADPLNWNTDTRSTAIILGALIRVDPKNALNANAVRWLMSNRENGYWKGTQENAWTLMALTNWIVQTGELKANYQYAAAFNGEALFDGTANADTIRQTQQLSVDVTKLLSDQANRLVLAREGDAGSLYYTAHLKLYLPVNQIQPLDRGVAVSRQYFKPDDPNTPVTEAQPGDVLVVRLTVVAPNMLHYLVVNDPLPAGLEAVDPTLKTNPQALPPDSYDWKRIDQDGWGWWYFSRIEMHDEKVVLSTDLLPAGTYVYTYLVRAATSGTFSVIPPTAEEFYFPEVYGRGAGSQFVVNQ